MADPLREADATVGKSSSDGRVEFWRKEIDLAHKREEKYQKTAERLTKLYEGDKRDDNSFNILYSNTCILLPACYNQLPRPFVDRRFKDEDPTGKLSAKTLERTLSALEDTGDAEYDPLDNLLEQAVLGALVPGRGSTKFKYEAQFTRNKTTVDDTAESGEDSGTTEGARSKEAGAGHKVLTAPEDTEKVAYETICGDDVDYDKVVFGYARRWVHVPWVGFIHYMEKADAKASFGAEIAELLKYSDSRVGADGWKKAKQGGDEGEDTQKGSLPVAVVYEIWNKRKKEVIFFAPSVKEQLLKEVPDPYGLSGFFPCPEPLKFFSKRSKQTPTPLYVLYEEQAKELNRLTQRINRILNALKVRGFYDGTLQGLNELLSADDNTLIPVRNALAMREGQTIENSIWFMPVKELIVVLQQLFPAREQCKNTIYEITGISDIMRGDTQASETATAQNIKNTYGTLRLNQFRKKVQHYARDCLRIMGELASKHFALETFAQMTDLDFALPKDIARAKKTTDFLNKQLMQMQQRATAMWQMQQQLQAGPPQLPPAGPVPPGAPQSPGAAPGPPQQAPAGPPQVQPTPQMQQAMQQAQAVLAKPKWEEVVGLLRDDLQRYYRIDIETNSTIASDTAEDKQNITDALGVMGEIFGQALPLAQQGVLPVSAFKALLLSTVRRFQFGREVEDSIAQIPDKLPPPPPPPGTPTPEEQQAKAAEAQAASQASQLKMQAAQRQEQLDQAKFSFDQARMQREEEMQQRSHALKLAQIDAKMQEIQAGLMATTVEARADVATAMIGVKAAKDKAAAAKQNGGKGARV